MKIKIVKDTEDRGGPLLGYWSLGIIMIASTIEETDISCNL